MTAMDRDGLSNYRKSAKTHQLYSSDIGEFFSRGRPVSQSDNTVLRWLAQKVLLRACQVCHACHATGWFKLKLTGPNFLGIQRPRCVCR